MDNVENNNDYEIDDFDEFDDEPIKLSWYEKAINWAAGHKTAVCASVIGLPILLICLGAKMFSKTETVEVAPDPSVLERYNLCPKETIATTTYEWILKEESKDVD